MSHPDHPLVTIVMPVLNEERDVEAAIDSALQQTEQRTEVLVVDGRSEDRTVEVVEAVARREPRVRLLHNPSRTIPAGLNVGLAHARGEFLQRVDAHLVVNDTYLERGLATLDAHPEAAAVGGCRIGVAGSATGRAVAIALSSPFGVGDSINHYATEPQETDHASMGVYRTAVLRAVGGWDETLKVNEDVDLDHRILALGHRIRYDPAMVMHWSVRESLRDFARQYRRYGRGKAGMVRKNGAAAVRLRHLVPPALVLTLATGAVAALTGHRGVGAVLLAPYPLGLAGAVARTPLEPDAGVDLPVRLAGAFATMHLAWGLGFLEGLAGAEPVTSSARAPQQARGRHHSSR